MLWPRLVGFGEGGAAAHELDVRCSRPTCRRAARPASSCSSKSMTPKREAALAQCSLLKETGIDRGRHRLIEGNRRHLTAIQPRQPRQPRPYPRRLRWRWISSKLSKSCSVGRAAAAPWPWSMAAAAMRPIIHPLRQHAQPELRDRLCGLADVWCVMRADDATTSSGAPDDALHRREWLQHRLLG